MLARSLSVSRRPCSSADYGWGVDDLEDDEDEWAVTTDVPIKEEELVPKVH